MVFREPLMFPNCINFAEIVKYKCEGNKTIRSFSAVISDAQIWFYVAHLF